MKYSLLPGFLIYLKPISYIAIMLQRLNKWKWIITTVLCYLLLYILPASFIEKYYSDGFFLLVRKVLDNTFGKIPFPVYYLFIGVMLLVILKWFLHFFREKPQPFLQRIFKIASFVGFMITLFFMVWGFNYGRIPVEKKLGLDIQPLTNEQLISETNATVEKLSLIRNKIKKDTTSLPQIIFINKIEDNSRHALNMTLHQYDYAYSEKIRGRFLYDDMLLVFSIGGQYLPYVGEGNVDDAVFYSKKPFYLMHEMAHGNGFTEEADCNFLAYISCVQSNNISLQYSGELNYLLYLFSELRQRDEETFNSTKEKLPKALRNDLRELKQHMEKHTFKSGVIGDVINNAYLKVLGVQDGIRNYDKMVLLVYAWKNKN